MPRIYARIPADPETVAAVRADLEPRTCAHRHQNPFEIEEDACYECGRYLSALEWIHEQESLETEAIYESIRHELGGAE